MVEHCELCPRRCGVDRAGGQRGYCKAGANVTVFRYGAHRGEEPPISGFRGSGTVFFSRCTLRCLYCQNYPWSQDGEGREYDVDGLAAALRSLAEAGCHNWNLVSPTPWLPWIRAAAKQLRKDGFSLPFVYNTSGFERIEVLQAYRDLADVFLTDLRYATEESAAEGSDARGYVDAARAALQWMCSEAGPLHVDDDGVATRGVICRILILPGRAQEAVDNLRWIAKNIGTDVAVSLMSQYVPAHRAATLPPWNRRINGEEYGTAVAALEELGFDNGWVQELEAEAPPELVGFQMKAGAS